MKSIIGIILITTTVLTAQQAGLKVKWGREFSAPRSSTVSDIIGFDQTGFYVLKKTFRGGLLGRQVPNIERFDNNLNMVKSIELDLTEAGEKTNLQYLLHLNGRLLMFSSFPNQQI